MTVVRKAVPGTVVGALLGLAATVLLYALDPEIVLDMDRDVTRVVRGLHGPERVG